MKNPFNRNYFMVCLRGNSKEYFLCSSPALGNLILDDGRYDLLPVEKLTPKDFKITVLDGKKIIERVTEPTKPEILKPETFFEKVKRKYKHVIDLVVGVTDLFTKGAASKIENSIYKIFTDDTATENENIILNKAGSNTMLETLKGYLVSYVVKFLLTLSGGFLIKAGATESDLLELVGGLVSLIVAVVWQLVTHKKVALTDPKDIVSIK